MTTTAAEPFTGTTATTSQNYEDLLAGAIDMLKSNEADLDELDSRNRDEHAYVPSVEAFYVAYKTNLQPDDSSEDDSV